MAAMATNVELLAQQARLLEKQVFQLAEHDIAQPQLATLLQEYRVTSETIIFADFHYASSKGIEDRLWDAHYKVNSVFKPLFRNLRRNPKDHIVEHRKLSKLYLQFIKATQKFYRQYILNLDARSDGIPELRNIAQKWKNDASGAFSRRRIPSSMKAQVLRSCHQTLIRLGDLSRYRETELVDKDRNWGPAIGFYNLANELIPESGQSQNQLAVIAREDGNHFRSIYHLYRSLATKEPHPQSKPNLEHEFKKIIQAWNKGQLINNHKSSDANSAGRALIAWFIRLHSKCYQAENFPQRDELENEVLSQLAIELKERSIDSLLHKIVLINMAAEYFATERLKDPNSPSTIVDSYFYYLRFNVKTFFTLLQIFQPELERLSERDDVTKQNGSRSPQLSDKITPVARRVLPSLRLYSTWILRYWRVLNSGMANSVITIEVQELWKAYAATLTLLASSFPAKQLPADDYMLEEDADTIGFETLLNDQTKKLWYDKGKLKPKGSELERNHPNIEMLMRVRGLLFDGLQLHLDQEAPLDFDDEGHFYYREAGLPSELLASPHNRADPMDFPSFPQEVPVAEDPKTYSVAAASETASTTLAKDSAMNRMVDDLVGPDDGLDPLPEEDENIPPTPPEQTFEDTTMVTDSTYGLGPMGPMSITDLVSKVQNYKKRMGSPSAQFLSTPMNRVASSSSIRQPANLPSLPDGQYNGTSIWNRNYNGTPGPSSPLLGNDIGTPLNGLRPSGAPGHVRGDSSNSLRSSDWTLHTAPPVQQPVSGGLGSGAAWGNPAVPLYGSMYGNSFGGYNNENNASLGLASPLLFGKVSSWRDSERNCSSYGPTPPNGQGG